MTPVPYPVALLAKEAGFDEPTKHWYDAPDGVPEYGAPKLANFNSGEWGNTLCSAPYPADLVDWLWRKHRLWCSVYLENGSEFSYAVDSEDGTVKIGDGFWGDPHTALVAALEAGLRWVINKEQ